jgi:hypothetical protein
LGVAQDPENLDGVIYGTTAFTLNFRAGPGKHFAALGTVPAGAEVPVLGWMTDRLRNGEFWIRTEYGGKRGWLCAFIDGERLIEREGGPLFPITVKAEKSLFEYQKESIYDPWYPRWLGKGDEVEFASLWGESRLESDAEDIDFWVKHGGSWGHLCAYATEEYIEGQRSSIVIGYPGTKLSGWFVDFPPEFLALNFDYNYRRYDFEFVDGAAHRDYYLGPGFGFAKTDSVYLHAFVLFIEGRWGLAYSWNDWSWVYLGSEGKPNVQMTEYLAGGECPVPTKGGPRVVEDGINIAVNRDGWPSKRRLYFTLRAPYFCSFKEDGRVDFVDIYQPPESTIPVFSASAGPGKKDSWHETYLLIYALKVPESVDLDAPFRAATRMHYEGGQDFEMEFLCNAGK